MSDMLVVGIQLHGESREKEAQPMQYIAFDVHKRYTLAAVEDQSGPAGQSREWRINHTPGCFRRFLEERGHPGSPVAVETVGNYYWVVDEIEAAGFLPKLVNAGLAKKMLGCVNKTDKLDARGQNRLQRMGTLPTVWIPPHPLRDIRELCRARSVFVRPRTQMKHRVHSNLAKYGLPSPDVSDIFGKKGLALLRDIIQELPPHSLYTTEEMLDQVEQLSTRIKVLEQRMRSSFKVTAEVEILGSLPGVGFVLAVLIALEVGDINRFPSAEKLAAYSGLTPRVISSGGKTRFGKVRDDVNRYLKWGYVEAANSICRHQHRYPYRHVTKRLVELSRRKDHPTAIVAVGRHLAEATWWMLKKAEPYQEPCFKKEVSSARA